jgi:hypothetical protein
LLSAIVVSGSADGPVFLVAGARNCVVAISRSGSRNALVLRQPDLLRSVFVSWSVHGHVLFRITGTFAIDAERFRPRDRAGFWRLGIAAACPFDRCAVAEHSYAFQLGIKRRVGPTLAGTGFNAFDL